MVAVLALTLAGGLTLWLHPFSRFAPSSLVLEYQGQEQLLSSRDRIPAYTPLKFRLYGSGLMVCGQSLDPTAQVQYRLNSTKLSSSQVDQMLAQVKSVGFSSLKDQYYAAAAPIGEYQETITLDSGSGPKSVSYFNDGGPKPQAYSKTTTIINDWCQKATKPYQSARLRLVVKKVKDATNQEISQAWVNGQSIPTFNNERQLFTGALARQVLKTFANRTHGFFTANSAVYEVAIEPELPPTKIAVAKPAPKKQALIDTVYAESDLTNLNNPTGTNGTIDPTVSQDCAIDSATPACQSNQQWSVSALESSYEANYSAENGYGTTNIYPHPAASPNAVQYILFCPKQTQQCNGVNGQTGRLNEELGNLGGDAATVQKFYADNTGKEFDVAPVKLVYGQHEAQYYRECHGLDKIHPYCSDPDQAALLNVQDELPSGGKKIVILGFDNPSKQTCGVGEIGGDTAIVRSDGGCNTTATQAHELGHMLGLEHTPQDATNVMSGKNSCDLYSAEKATVCQLGPGQDKKLAQESIFHDLPAAPVPATPLPDASTRSVIPDSSTSTCSPGEFIDSPSYDPGHFDRYCPSEHAWYHDLIPQCTYIDHPEYCDTSDQPSSKFQPTPPPPPLQSAVQYHRYVDVAGGPDCDNDPTLEYCQNNGLGSSPSPANPGCCAFDQDLVASNPESEYCLATSSCDAATYDQSSSNCDNCATIDLNTIQGQCEYTDHPEYCDGNYGSSAPQPGPNDTCTNEGCNVPPPVEDHGIPGGPDCNNDPSLDYCVRNGITSDNPAESSYENSYTAQCEYTDHPEYCDGGSYGAGNSGEAGYEGSYEGYYSIGGGPDCNNDPTLEYCQNNGITSDEPPSEPGYEPGYEGSYAGQCEYTDHPEYCS